MLRAGAIAAQKSGSLGASPRDRHFCTFARTPTSGILAAASGLEVAFEAVQSLGRTARNLAAQLVDSLD